MDNQPSDLYNGTTSVLNISGHKLDANCSNVIETLMKSGINCNVIPNKSIMLNKEKKSIKENGCRITICGLNTKYLGPKIWKPLEKEFDIKCSHLSILGVYDGCIKNYLAPSLCSLNNK